MKKFKLVLAFLLVAGLVAGVAVPVMAKDKPAPPAAAAAIARKLHLVPGEVVAKGEDTFTIKRGEKEVVIKVTPDTKYLKGPFPALVKKTLSGIRAPLGSPQGRQELLKGLQRAGNGPLAKEVGFGDLAVGDKVTVQGVKENEEIVAKRVLIHHKPDIERVEGTVKAVTENGITLTAKDGAEISVAYSEKTVFILRGKPALQEGQQVAAVCEKTDEGLQAIEVRLLPPKKVSGGAST